VLNGKPNKALQPTAYSSGRKLPPLPAAAEFGRSAAARGLKAIHNLEKEIMSVDMYFVYETEDKDDFEVKEFGIRGLLPFLEYFPHDGTPEEIENFKNSVLFPTFVEDFAPPKERECPDIVNMSDEEFDEMLQAATEYRGPSFDPEELVLWMTTWLEIIELDEAARRVLIRIAEEAYGYNHDWALTIVEDMKQTVEQAKCAQRHNVQMHMEMH
jgi:hypothetical protein